MKICASISRISRIENDEFVVLQAQIPLAAARALSTQSDPKYFEDPDEISFKRPAWRHLSFGSGPHLCLGRVMARAEAIHAITVILDRLPSLRLDDERPMTYFPSSYFRALSALPLSIE